MTKNRNSLIILTCVMISLILSCKSDHKTSEKTPQTLTKTDSVSEKSSSWPDNNKFKKIKIDSSDFIISASKKQLSIKLERNESFENQIKKIKKVLYDISKDIDLSMLNRISINPINDELLFDIASVTEIQAELNKKREKGIVSSMKIISPNAYKSKKLKEITDLFSKHNLEPYNYYIDKCFPIKIKGDSINLSMGCASIYFNLRKK